METLVNAGVKPDMLGLAVRHKRILSVVESSTYEGAFVVRWLIQDQVKGAAPLRYDDAAGAAQVPLLLWGPYLWADGTTPRKADGLVWLREDLAVDGTHPSESGRRKVANLLQEHFTSDALAKSWFTSR